jgi:hypothetical protein
MRNSSVVSKALVAASLLACVVLWAGCASNVADGPATEEEEVGTTSQALTGVACSNAPSRTECSRCCQPLILAGDLLCVIEAGCSGKPL